MESIIENLSDPAWWFTAFVPTIAILLIAKFWRYLIPRIRKLSRWSRVQSLRRVREIRKDDLLISKEMLSTQAAFFVFIMFVVVGLMLLLLSPFNNRPGVMHAYALTLSVPIFVTEIAWLIKDLRIHELLRYRRRWLANHKAVCPYDKS